MESEKPNIGVAVGAAQDRTVLLVFARGDGCSSVAMPPDVARSLATSLMIFADIQEPKSATLAQQEKK